MSAFSGVRRAPARRVRPSLRDPRFASLIVGQSVNSVGSWASAIVLWGFATYRFNASPEAISVTVVCWSAPAHWPWPQSPSQPEPRASSGKGPIPASVGEYGLSLRSGPGTSASYS
jgi:hypothetical protein